MSDCCVKGFQWDGEPAGKEITLASRPTYVTGSSTETAILLIHDIFGWTFSNTRLLADAFASEANATVYVPDFFGGEIISPEILRKDPSEWHPQFDIYDFISRNGKELREPEIFMCAKALRLQYKRVAAVGYCFGGWAVFRLGAKGNNLVDCISMAHPSFLTEEEIKNVGVPVQILAAEIDAIYPPELKEFCNRVIPTLGVEYDYQHFKGLEHGFAVRGNLDNEAEKKGMERAKNAAVYWLNQWLHLN